MNKTSIASLQERLAGWTDLDLAMFYIGACLGFWPEFGAPGDATGPFDPWHGVKTALDTNDYYLSSLLEAFIYDLEAEGCLEIKDVKNGLQPSVRWNPKYKGVADLISTL